LFRVAAPGRRPEAGVHDRWPPRNVRPNTLTFGDLSCPAKATPTAIIRDDPR